MEGFRMARVVLTELAKLPEGENLRLNFHLQFYGADSSDADEISVVALPTDTINTIRTKIIDATRARATALGITVPSNGVFFPVYDKG